MDVGRLPRSMPSRPRASVSTARRLATAPIAVAATRRAVQRDPRRARLASRHAGLLPRRVHVRRARGARCSRPARRSCAARAPSSSRSAIPGAHGRPPGWPRKARRTPVYRTVQAFNSVAMSLAAVPSSCSPAGSASDRLALVAAALAVVLPELLYSRRCWRNRSPIRSRSPPSRPRWRPSTAATAAPAFLACSGLPPSAGSNSLSCPSVIWPRRGGRPSRAPVARGLREQWLAVGATVGFLTGGLGLGLVGSLGLYAACLRTRSSRSARRRRWA